MNRWKVSFFLLAGAVLAVIVYLFILIGSTSNSEPIPKAKEPTGVSNSMTVSATKKDFEGIANTFIRKAMKEEPLPVTMRVDDDIILSSELVVFSYKLPVKMYFDPHVLEDGNLLLKQSKLEVGPLDLPPSTVLKVLKDSVDLPPWMIVRAKEEEIFIDLSDLPISSDLHVKAKQVNLKEDEILLEISIPEN